MTLEQLEKAERLEALLAKAEAQKAEFELLATLSHQLFDEEDDEPLYEMYIDGKAD